MRRPPLSRLAISVAGCCLMMVPFVAPAGSAPASRCTTLVASAPTTMGKVPVRAAGLSGCSPQQLLGGSASLVTNLRTHVTKMTWAHGRGTTFVKLDAIPGSTSGHCPAHSRLVENAGTVIGGSGDALNAIAVGENVHARFCVAADSTMRLEPGTQYQFTPVPAAVDRAVTTTGDPASTTTTTRPPTTTTTRPPTTTTTRPPTTTTTTTTTTTSPPPTNPPATSPPPPPPPPPSPAPSGALPAGLSDCPGSANGDMISLVNRDRGGLPGLAENSNLDAAARMHSIAMASSSNMTHDGWDSEIAASGFVPGSPGYMGQNVAMRSGGYSADAIEAMFFNETPPNDGHRQNILSTNYHQIGVSCVINNSTGVYWWTQDFGS